jgi:parvulin-like peptidyl-prolyl isomerase
VRNRKFPFSIFLILFIVSIAAAPAPCPGFAAPERKKAEPAESVNWPEGETAFVFDNTPFPFGDVKIYHLEIMNDGTSKALTREEVRRAVDSMVLDLALYEEAVAKSPKILDSPEVDSLVGKFRLPRLRKIFFEREVAPGAAVTLDEYAGTLPLPGVRYEISMILAADQDKINEIFGKLKAGEDFAGLARKHSEGFSADKGGKMGLVGEEKEDILTRLEFQNVKKVPEGRFTEPFHSRVGWAIVRVDRIWNPVDIRREGAKASFETFRIEKEKEYFRKRMEEIRAGATVRIDQPLVDELASLVKEGKSVPQGYFEREIASVNGRKIYAGDVQNVLATHSEESVNLYLDRRIHQELIAQEAEKTGLPDARYGKILDMKRRHEVARVFLREAAETAVRVSDEEMADYYGRNKGKFAVPERRMLRAIETKDAAKSGKALDRIKKGKDFKEVARSFNDGKEAREKSGEVGYVRREDLIGEIAQKVFSMKRGEVSGPHRMATREGGSMYVVLKVEEIRPARILPYEQVDKDVLRDRIVSRKRSGVYDEIFRRLLEKHAVELKGNAGEGKSHEEKR